MPESVPVRGFHTSASTARILSAAGGPLLAGASDTGGRFTLIQTTIPPGDSTPLHCHTSMDESFYVFSGSFRVTCGEDVFHASPGDFVHLPRGIPHKYVAEPGGGQMLILATPGGLEGFFDDWESGMVPEELAHKYNIEFLD
ncbi:MAG: cupin domain-containing protein [Streptosporangiales bacterium]|nr:cupin domain-containing protein [Streptosporangiales bacterium]